MSTRDRTVRVYKRGRPSRSAHSPTITTAVITRDEARTAISLAATGDSTTNRFRLEVYVNYGTESVRTKEKIML